MDYESILLAVKPFGKFQKRFFAMVFLSVCPSAIIDMMFAFTQYETSFRCALPTWINTSGHCVGLEALLNSSIPWETDSFGVPKRSQCKIYRMTEDIANCSVNLYNNSDELDCQYGYHFEDENTATAEFEMVCGESWKAALAITISMVGIGLGSFLGFLSDKFGRRLAVLFFKIAQVIITALLSFSWNYNSYVTFILLSGLCSTVTYVALFVLASEMVGVQKRFQVAIATSFAYTVGYLVSPLIGFFLPNWRWFLRANFFLGLLYIPLFCYLPESLRWYLVSKKEKQSKDLLEKIANENGVKIDADVIYERFQQFQSNKEKSDDAKSKKSISRNETSYFLQWRISTMRLRYFALCISWIAATMIYYAISLYPTYLSGNRLLNIFLSALVELPAVAIAYYLSQFCGRVRATSLLYILCGLSCAVSPFIKKVNATAVTVLVLISKATVTAAFDLIYLITAEVSPTLVRSTSLCVASACARMGGIAMPFLMLAGKGDYDFIPFLTMGIISIIAGILYIFFIPETSNIAMPDSLDMALNNKRAYGLKLCRTFEEVASVDEAEDQHSLSIAPFIQSQQRNA